MEITHEEYPVVGTVLASKDGHTRSNGIVVATEYPILVLTDFGNIIEFTNTYQLARVYEVSDKWIEAKLIDYPLPSIEERIDEQIVLLQAAKKKLCGTSEPVAELEREVTCFNKIIEYALEQSADDGHTLLHLWNEGSFSVIKEEWPDAPEEIFYADPLYKN